MAVHAGREVFINIDTSDVGGTGANWTKIGQQRGGGISRTSETADATHKDDQGYPSAVITRTPWSVSADGALDPTDSVYAQLVTAWKNKNKVWVQSDEGLISGEVVEGQAIITDLSKEFPESDLVSYTCELQGDGELASSP